MELEAVDSRARRVRRKAGGSIDGCHCASRAARLTAPQSNFMLP